MPRRIGARRTDHSRRECWADAVKAQCCHLFQTASPANVAYTPCWGLPMSSNESGERRRTDLETRLSREFGLRVPLASAGMAFVGLTDLTAAVSNAGALGVYGVGPEPPPVVAARIQAIREHTRAPFGVDFIVD